MPARLGPRRNTRTHSGPGFNGYVSKKGINTSGAVKIASLSFDPIEELITQLREIEGHLAIESAAERPDPKRLILLQERKFKILELLLPYRYGKVATTPEEEAKEDSQPVTIILEGL